MSEYDNAIRNTLARIMVYADKGVLTSQFDKDSDEFKNVLDLFEIGRQLIPNYKEYI